MSTRTHHARRPVLIGSVCGALILGATSCGPVTDGAQDTSRTAPDIASAPVNSTRADGDVATEQTPVYWVGTGTESAYLFREFRSTDVPDIADPVAEAAILMTKAAPLDQDYRSLWTAVDTVGTSVSPGGTITVDLPATAFNATLSAEDAHLALQQLVYTVSAAAVTAGLLDAETTKDVRILVDGEAGYRAFGAVTLDDPIARDQNLPAPVWLIDPQTDTSSPSPLPLFGRLLPEVKSARWEVTSGEETVAGADVRALGPSVSASGASSTGTEFRVPVDLGPGKYEVRVIGTLADGSQITDDHTVTVTGD